MPVWGKRPSVTVLVLPRHGLVKTRSYAMTASGPTIKKKVVRKWPFNCPQEFLALYMADEENTTEQMEGDVEQVTT